MTAQAGGLIQHLNLPATLFDGYTKGNLVEAAMVIALHRLRADPWSYQPISCGLL